MRVQTFRDVEAPERVGTWDQVRVEEAATRGGTPVEIDRLDFDPPVAGGAIIDLLTTEQATLDPGWYWLTFFDADGDESPRSLAIQAPAPGPLRPELADVGALLRARTRSDATGGEIGTFDETTRPTGDQVDGYIDSALTEVQLSLPASPPERLEAFARGLVALRAAMAVEVSLEPDRSESDNSAFARLKELYDQDLALLVTAVSDGIPTQHRGVASVRIASPTLAADTANAGWTSSPPSP